MHVYVYQVSASQSLHSIGGGVVDSRILKKLMVEKQNVYLSLLLIYVLTIFVILNIGALSYF